MRLLSCPAFLSFLLLTSLALSPGCKKSDSPPASGAAASKVVPAPVALAEPAPQEAHASESGIQWIENDYAKALALAKSEKKPLVIDMWADWCHTCLAMKKGVLSDRGLSSVAGDYVWLAVDTEDPDSAAAMAKFPPKVWPTFLVVSPLDESIQASQMGSCSVSAFRGFLTRGTAGHLAQREAGGDLEKGSPLARVRAGDRAWIAGDYAEAAASYDKALQGSAPDWSHRAQTQMNQISALAKLDDKKACARLGASKLDAIAAHKNSASSAFIYYAGTCAAALGKAEAAKLRARLLDASDMMLADADAPLSYDDRSDVLGVSRALAEELRQAERAQDYARTQQKLLAQAVKEAHSATEEMTYVWHQVEVHAFLGEGEAILPWVESLETRLPEEYDPPYRKAWLLAKMKRNQEAHAALQVALPLVRGARRGRLLSLDADVYKAQGNQAKERESREAVLAHYQSLPEGQRSQSKIDSAQEALAAMDGK